MEGGKKDGEKSYRYRVPAIQLHSSRYATRLISKHRLLRDI